MGGDHPIGLVVPLLLSGAFFGQAAMTIGRSGDRSAELDLLRRTALVRIFLGIAFLAAALFSSSNAGALISWTAVVVGIVALLITQRQATARRRSSVDLQD
jgi:hypothetical protein